MGTGGLCAVDGWTRGHVSSVGTFDSISLVRLLRLTFFRWGKRSVSRPKFEFNMFFRIFLGLQQLCVTTHSSFFKRVNVRTTTCVARLVTLQFRQQPEPEL